MNQEKSVARYAWLIVGLLVPVALLNYLDRQMIAAMKTSVMNDVTGFANEKAWGQMLAQFKWVYAFLSPIGGYVGDRFGRKLTICGSLFAWSVITFATGHVTTYDGLLWTRTLMGVSEAFYIPAALALISDYHTGGTRSRATGLHQMGIYCGVILGGFSGYVADSPDHGWRWMFNVTGLVGIIYAPILLMVLRDVPKSVEASQSTPRIATSLRDLLTNSSFVLLVIYFTLPAIAGWVVRDWMPAILQEQFNLSQGRAGVSATLYWQAAAIVAAFFGGWLADRWMKRTDRGRIYVSAIGMALIIPALFGVGNAPNLNSISLAIASLVLFGIGWGFFDGNNMPILSQIVRPDLRATGYGIMNFVSINIGGFADIQFGALKDSKVPLNLIFSSFAVIAMVSVVLVLMIKPRPQEN